MRVGCEMVKVDGWVQSRLGMAGFSRRSEPEAELTVLHPETFLEGGCGEALGEPRLCCPPAPGRSRCGSSLCLFFILG